jgi:hypothetical protein
MTYANPTTYGMKFSDILRYVNDVTQNWFGNLVIFAIFIIAFVCMKNYSTKKAFTAASFITTILASLFFFLGILNELVLFIFIFATAVGVISILRERD